MSTNGPGQKKDADGNCYVMEHVIMPFGPSLHFRNYMDCVTKDDPKKGVSTAAPTVTPNRPACK